MHGDQPAPIPDGGHHGWPEAGGRRGAVRHAGVIAKIGRRPVEAASGKVALGRSARQIPCFSPQPETRGFPPCLFFGRRGAARCKNRRMLFGQEPEHNLRGAARETMDQETLPAGSDAERRSAIVVCRAAAHAAVNGPAAAAGLNEAPPQSMQVPPFHSGSPVTSSPPVGALLPSQGSPDCGPVVPRRRTNSVEVVAAAALSCGEPSTTAWSGAIAESVISGTRRFQGRCEVPATEAT